ncbi:MAG: Maf family nucleotide pyrophosphatase [Gammaproteobacteria bacterium]|nr:Maf family nucleotide pyrophosphatase [Gammaproteobacteria bacterium]
MTHPSPTLILASSSVYRRALLDRLLSDYRCISPDIDETPQPLESPSALALRLAEEKARAVASPYENAIIIGSDQAPALGDQILHKPGDHARAAQQLAECSGRSVIFNTAVAIFETVSQTVITHLDETIVHFRQLNEAEIETYLQLDEPYDCAGSFKVESRGVVLFDRIESQDPTALQGLPLIWVAHQLRTLGVTFT